MKIGLIIANNTYGGAQKVAIHLYDWLSKLRETTVKIIVLKQSSKNGYDMTDRNLIQIRGKFIVTQLRKIYKSEQFDVVLSMGVPLCVYTVPAILGYRTVHIVSERNDPAHFNGKYIVKIVSRFLMRFADGFVFQTKAAQDYYKMAGRINAVVIHNPLSDLHSLPDQPFSGKRRKEIVTAGRLVPQKNHELLIKAFFEVLNDYADFELSIWGEGEENGRLQELINSLGIEDRVTLQGITTNLVEKIYDSYMFVLSSNFEGMPNALIEAMSLGLPCISTDCPCGGPGELIINHHNGLLVEVNSKEQLKNAIEEIIRDESLAKKIGKNAYNIRDDLKPDVICEKWYNFFRIIASQKLKK